MRRLRQARGWIWLAVATGLGSGLLLIVQAALLSHIVHRAFIDGVSRAAMGRSFAMLCGVIVLRAGLAWAREVTGFQAGARIRGEVRRALMQHLARLGPVQNGGLGGGELSATMVEQVEALQAFYAHYLPQLALAVAIPAAIVAFVWPISWAAGGLLLLTAPLIPLFMILVGMGAESISQRHFQALARMSAHFLDTLQGLPTLKLLDRSHGEESRIAATSDQYRQRTMSVLRVAFLSTAVLELFSSLAIALVAVYLGTTYLGYSHFGMYGRPLSLYQGLFILLLAPDFYLPLRELGTHYHARAEAIGAAQEILKILSRAPAQGLKGQREPTLPDALTVDCQDLSFTYEGRREPALDGCSLRLDAGDRVVLVGESGAGKTTLLNLLLGFIQPQRGSIRVNGRDLSELTPESWHRALAWVGQHPMVFHGTIAGNIAMGKPAASRSQIEQAARAARVTDFAQHLPRGLDTPVGEQGWGLSRGQAQRVALARVFLKDAPLLLLDEPTAGLDMENEQMVMAAIETLSQGRTVVLSTHRLHHIEQAQRVVVLSAGRIAAQGRYDDLIDRIEPFRDLIRARWEEGP
jgi:ATP-binding cassette subfamily C protein CydD